jgi:hypothetical protein
MKNERSQRTLILGDDTAIRESPMRFDDKAIDGPALAASPQAAVAACANRVFFRPGSRTKSR